jgi:hypothetical protein
MWFQAIHYCALPGIRHRVGRVIAYYHFRMTVGNGDCRSAQGEMGKGWTNAAKFAVKVDCRRWGALAFLFLEGVLVSFVLSYNYGSSPRISTERRAITTSTTGVIDHDWLAPATALANSDRFFYAYSVIPGGVRNAAELRDAVARDQTVAEHYADFNLSNARVMRLKKASLVFVSFRVGSQIFWTKNQLRLPAGETVVTDGGHMARTRCGNRLSEVPIGPVLSNEPLPEAMDIPADGALLAAPEYLSEVPLAMPPTTAIVVPPQPPLFIPIVPPLFPLGGTTTSTPGIPSGPLPPPSGTPPSAPPPSGPPPSGPPPISTPEPADFLMLAAGCGCVWLLRRRDRA